MPTESPPRCGRAMDETERRRARQLAWNAEHGIVPKTVSKSLESPLDSLYGGGCSGRKESQEQGRKENSPAEAMPEKPEDIAKLIGTLEKDMRSAAGIWNSKRQPSCAIVSVPCARDSISAEMPLEDRAEAVAMQEPASAMGRKAGRRERAEAGSSRRAGGKA